MRRGLKYLVFNAKSVDDKLPVYEVILITRGKYVSDCVGKMPDWLLETAHAMRLL